MPSSETEDQELSERANALYWESGKSVNQIAEEMDLSKSRLYGLVQPLSAGRPCPECSADLRYPNRTAMEKGFASCTECSFEGLVDDGRSRGASPAEEPTIAAPPLPRSRVPTVGAQRAVGAKRAIWGSALLGVAAGLFVAFRRRRS